MQRYWRANERRRTCELGEGCSGNSRRQTTIPCKVDATGGEKSGIKQIIITMIVVIIKITTTKRN